MDFDLDDVQRSFAQSLRSALADRMGPADLRRVWEVGPAYDHGCWGLLGDLGATAVLVPAQFDGLGADPTAMVAVLESCGAAAVPEPVAEAAVIAPLVLSRYASAELCHAWLPGLAAGELLITVAPGADGPVPDGLTSDAVIVVRDGTTWLAPRDAVSGVPLEGSDPARRLARITVDQTRVHRISGDRVCADLVRHAGAVATAGLLVGLSTRLVEQTRDYVLTREQFGVQIGSFQALKHRLADCLLLVEAARSLTWHALTVLTADGPEAVLAAHHAKAAASVAGQACGYAALQLHGGIGFTWEHDLHLFLQRGRAWEAAYGDAASHRQAAGRLVLTRGRSESAQERRAS